MGMKKTQRTYGKDKVAIQTYVTRKEKAAFRMFCAERGLSMSEGLHKYVEQKTKGKA